MTPRTRITYPLQPLQQLLMTLVTTINCTLPLPLLLLTQTPPTSESLKSCLLTNVVVNRIFLLLSTIVDALLHA